MSTKTVGPVTTAAGTGTGVAGVASILITWGLTQAGVDVPPAVATAITTLCALLGAMVGGWLAPSQADRVQEAVAAVVPTAEDIATAATSATTSTDGPGSFEVPLNAEQSLYAPAHGTGSTAAASADAVTTSATPV